MQNERPRYFYGTQGLYRQNYAATQEPDEEYILPFGKGRIVNRGDQLTLITWGAMVQKSLDAIRSLALSDGLIEVIDLRTLNPVDLDLIEISITKTNKVFNCSRG